MPKKKELTKCLVKTADGEEVLVCMNQETLESLVVAVDKLRESQSSIIETQSVTRESLNRLFQVMQDFKDDSNRQSETFQRQLDEGSEEFKILNTWMIQKIAEDSFSQKEMDCLKDSVKDKAEGKTTEDKIKELTGKLDKLTMAILVGLIGLTSALVLMVLKGG